MLTKDEWRKGFAVYENTITGLYEACKPQILGKPIVRSVAVFQYASQGLKWAANQVAPATKYFSGYGLVTSALISAARIQRVWGFAVRHFFVLRISV